MTCRRLLFVGALQLKFRLSENCESVLIHRLLSGRNHKELHIYIYIYIYICMSEKLIPKSKFLYKLTVANLFNNFPAFYATQSSRRYFVGQQFV